MAKKIYQDDVFVHLESDIEKMRKRFRQYISYSGSRAALALFTEGLLNARDEIKSPRSPGTKIEIEYNDLTQFVDIKDDGRGIPTSILFKLFTSLNMGSNIDTSEKSSLKVDIVGQNGTGTLAICALSEQFTVTSYRGGTENKYLTLYFNEGKLIDQAEGTCTKNKHGLYISFKPSQILGKGTKFVLNDIKNEIENFAYLNKDHIKVSVTYITEKGTETHELSDKKFEDILNRNGENTLISSVHSLSIDRDGFTEEIDGEYIPRFVGIDVCFAYTNLPNPYIDSFSNSNNTIDGGDHIDATIESLCRYFQSQAKNTISERDKDKLDIKWDDVKSGLTIAVSLRTNWERLYTSQTKHKVVSVEIKKIIQQMISDQLPIYFNKNTNKLKELISIIKMNAKARREGDKVKNTVSKSSLSTYDAYKMKNFNPCTAKGKEYKEIYLIEGDRWVS